MGKKQITDELSSLLKDLIIAKSSLDDSINMINIKSSLDLIKIDKKYKLNSACYDLQNVIESLDEFIKGNK